MDPKYIGAIVVVVVIIGIWIMSKPKPQPTSGQTDVAAMASLQDTLKNVSSNVEGFDDSEFMKDPAVYKDNNIQNLAKNATTAMNLLIDPKNQKLCTRDPTELYQLMNNIDSVLHQAFKMGVSLNNSTYPQAIANLMLIRLTLVGIATYKKNYIRVAKNETGNVMSVLVLPGLQRHIVSIIDKIFDDYENLPMNVRMYVDENKARLEAQFSINTEEVKPVRGKKSSQANKDKAKNSIQSSFMRTIPISTFVVVLVLLASKIEQPDCNIVKSS